MVPAIGAATDLSTGFPTTQHSESLSLGFRIGFSASPSHAKLLLALTLARSRPISIHFPGYTASTFHLPLRFLSCYLNHHLRLPIEGCVLSRRPLVLALFVIYYLFDVCQPPEPILSLWSPLRVLWIGLSGFLLSRRFCCA
jgi:hypothetical protein